MTPKAIVQGRRQRDAKGGGAFLMSMSISKIDEDSDEMRPEYDLRKLKFVGRGIYAERFRRGMNLDRLCESDIGSDEKNAEGVPYDRPG